MSAEVASWDMFCQPMGHFLAVALRREGVESYTTTYGDRGAALEHGPQRGMGGVCFR